MREVIEHVWAQLEYQEQKHGPDPIKLEQRWAVLMEEVGEVARAEQEGTPEEVYEELLQVAAVAIRWASML